MQPRRHLSPRGTDPALPLRQRRRGWTSRSESGAVHAAVLRGQETSWDGADVAAARRPFIFARWGEAAPGAQFLAVPAHLGHEPVAHTASGKADRGPAGGHA